jgi:nicotinate-nucleotide pyrophosphorylase (carboxylating)
MLHDLIQAWLAEDIGEGDHSTIASIPLEARSTARLLIKESGVIAGLNVAKQIYELTDTQANIKWLKNDGDSVLAGDLAFIVEGNARNILTTERLILNCMQRMSGIATKTQALSQKIAHTSAKLLDTRKTTPGFRLLEKEAVRIGGGSNHRFGLYDMIMLKDNHIDFCGGIQKAVNAVNAYKTAMHLTIPVEVEVRNEAELQEVIQTQGVNRILLDNFSPKQISACLYMIPPQFEIEASGGITEDNIVEFAEAGVHYISVGALTHHVKSLDLSLKAIIY